MGVRCSRLPLIEIVTPYLENIMDISIPIAQLNEALRILSSLGFTEDEIRAECETAIDNAIEE